MGKYEESLKAALEAEIIEVFEQHDMLGAEQWSEEIESLVRVIVDAHSREE